MELSIVRVVLVNVLLLLVQQVFTSGLEKDDDLFPVSIIHINDFHARYYNNFYLFFLTFPFEWSLNFFWKIT